MRVFLRAAFVLSCAFMLVAAALHAQGPAPTPIITSINPSNVAAGAPGFTLTVTGSGFAANSVVRLNGSNRATVFAGPTQLMAMILPGDIAAPGQIGITVFNPSATSPGFTSNTAILAVGNPPPTLTSAAPGFLAQGVGSVRMTLLGANFRPGATVVISPPIASLGNSTGAMQATDVAVESVQRVSNNLIIAEISLAPEATAGLRGIDVVNADGSSTAGGLTFVGTTQPLRISAGTSLAAPLSVVTIAVTHPRDGTLVMQGDDLYGEAILAGTGSGTVIGEWLWDGNVTEQFVSVFAGGQRATLRTQRSFPTSFLGVHTVELRITQPNQILSRPIKVVVNPGDWQLQKILGPGYGAGFSADAPPTLRWAPVPGALKYQVGFTTRPYFSTIETWHDVNDNQWKVPQEIWDALPEGEMYWTVRTVESSDVPRKPMPLRRIVRFAPGALRAVAGAAERTSAGNALIVWQGLPQQTLYRVTISEDADATKILRRYLTADARLDLRALRGKLTPGQTYYWQVGAISADGQVLLEGAPQSFVAPAGPQARAQGDPRFVLTSFHANAPAAPGANSYAPLPADIASLIASRSPLQDSTVNDAKPAVAIAFTAPVNPADMALMVDDTDVTSLAQVADTKISYTPALALASGSHSVNLTIANEAASWTFTVQVAAPPSSQGAASGGFQSGTDAEAPPASGSSSAASGGAAGNPPASGANASSSAAKPGNGKNEHPGAVVGPQGQTQVSSNTQWASGSAPDTNAITIGQQMVFQDGKWRVEMNGSGLLNTTFNPEIMRGSMGLVNDYVFRVAYDGGDWGSNLRFGILTPALYRDSEFVTTATARQGVEFTLRTKAGSFAYFRNTNDVALGGGAGVSFHQNVQGASWDAPLPVKRAEFRLMWLSAGDTGAPTTVMFDSMGNPILSPDPVGTPGAGDAYGAVFLLHLSKQWVWTSEYSWSYDNPDVMMAGSHRLFGRAWRTGVNGTIHKAAVSVVYRDVGPNFASPANPSLSLLSNPDRRGVDASLSDPTRIGVFSLGYSFLESDIKDANNPEQILHNFTETWSKPINPKTILAWNAHETLTLTGTVPAAVLLLPPDQQKMLEPDQQDLGTGVTLTHQVGKVSLSLGASRDWFRNNNVSGQNVITSSILGGANWSANSFFQLNSNVSVNWVAADASTTGTTRNVSGYLQPTFMWKRMNFQVAPLASVNTVRTQLIMGMLTNDTLTEEYGGRVSWQMPGHFKFNTLSMEGDETRDRDNISGMNIRSTQLLLLWTIVWGRHFGLQ